MLERILGFFRSLRAFNRPFWTANVSELFERIAFYGMTPILVPYLTQVRGVDEAAAIRLSGTFGLVVYGLPVLSGFVADLLGYRRAMLLAYALLAAGYALVGQADSYALVAIALIPVALGASLIKPAITGTVQKTCSASQRAVGFSIYYTLVNVGGFLGPNVSGQLGDRLGIERIFVVSAAVAGVALLIVLVGFRDSAPTEGETPRRVGDFLRDFGAVLGTPRLVVLFLLVAGFWSMFFQFYGAFTLYLTGDLGLSQGTANFVISLNALAIILFQVLVGYLTRGWAASRALWIAAVVASCGLMTIGLHASATAAALGVLLFAVGEMIYAAHFYHYIGSIAPPSQVGMYMGFAFLPVALGSFLAGQIGGPVAQYSRDTLGQPRLMWFGFAAVGLAAALGLWLHARIVSAASPAPTHS